MQSKQINLEKFIRDVKDFPIEGIIFKDISPLLANGKALHCTIHKMAELAKDADVIIGPDARGFLFGTPTAAFLKKPFIMVRKPKKLPGDVISFEYELEYGTSTLEIQTNMLKPGQKVAIIDDVLATGGTMKAITDLIESQGAVVHKIVFLLELVALNGIEKLKNYDVSSLIRVE
ncbi:adenine phosphoribosyltransferase [Mycoplasma sp. 1654_15]|uniref:adenine phosphoribosyltransferase n=1 Tax=Mycoplasma sp. 1654_15 TaxID=2725994 RepID=UPI0014498AE7|nr:adenine phosphoribosyltransferase [Mycoplasma sp. 1654_15]QJB71082.1 adenine phosphoribosyltransferase [Mycoplasma sp. 1654_15]